MQPVGAQAGSKAGGRRVLAAATDGVARYGRGADGRNYQNERIAAENDMIIRNRPTSIGVRLQTARSVRRVASRTS